MENTAEKVQLRVGLYVRDVIFQSYVATSKKGNKYLTFIPFFIRLTHFLHDFFNNS